MKIETKRIVPKGDPLKGWKVANSTFITYPYDPEEMAELVKSIGRLYEQREVRIRKPGGR